jgi:hypothetical protein
MYGLPEPSPLSLDTFGWLRSVVILSERRGGDPSSESLSMMKRLAPARFSYALLKVRRLRLCSGVVWTAVSFAGDNSLENWSHTADVSARKSVFVKLYRNW